MLEMRVRADWFGCQEVPALRFESKGIPSGDEVVIEQEPGEPFRALEIDVELGAGDFFLSSVKVDGEEQLRSPISLEHLLDGPNVKLAFPVAEEQIAIKVKNVSDSSSSLRLFVLGRTRLPMEKDFG